MLCANYADLNSKELEWQRQVIRILLLNLFYLYGI